MDLKICQQEQLRRESQKPYEYGIWWKIIESKLYIYINKDALLRFGWDE